MFIIHSMSFNHLVGTVHKQPLAESFLELLLTRLASPATEDQLRPELPLEWDVPVLSGLLVNDWVVMLEVGTKTLSLKRYPQSVLVHSIGVLTPVAKMVCIQWERLAQVLNRLGVLVEQDLQGCC